SHGKTDFSIRLHRTRPNSVRRRKPATPHLNTLPHLFQKRGEKSTKSRHTPATTNENRKKQKKPLKPPQPRLPPTPNNWHTVCIPVNKPKHLPMWQKCGRPG
ncbi:MAG: hypothetical protein ACK5MO_05350, partial [Planctomyces sp.]